MKRYAEVTTRIRIEADTKNGIRTAMREGRKHGFFPLLCVGPGYTWTPESHVVKAIPSGVNRRSLDNGAERIMNIARMHANAFMLEIDVRGTDAQWMASRDRLAEGLASIHRDRMAAFQAPMGVKTGKRRVPVKS